VLVHLAEKVSARESEGQVMAMPQRDDTIEELKRLDALLEWAVVHGEEAEAERLREKLRKLLDSMG